MLIYTDEIKLRRRQLCLKTNKANNAQMSELLITVVSNPRRKYQEFNTILK